MKQQKKRTSSCACAGVCVEGEKKKATDRETKKQRPLADAYVAHKNQLEQLLRAPAASQPDRQTGGWAGDGAPV
jgi:hypothetical protein